MYTVSVENGKSNIKSAVDQIVPILNTVVEHAANSKFGAGLQITWFKDQAASQAMRDKLKAMNDYVNKRCTRLTFVVKEVNHYVDSAPVEQGDFAQVINSDYVSSGTRVFILPSFAEQEFAEKVNTICHELSHRVLQTTDWPSGRQCYGRTAALALNGADSLVCAENWGYFYMELAQELGILK